MEFNNTNSQQENVVVNYIEYAKKQRIDEERKRLWNLFGFVPDKYIKYVNIIVIELTATLFFAFLYYILLLDFDKNYFIPEGFPREHFFNHKFLIAIYMSINFQTTTAYVDIKCKSILSRTIIILQLITTVAIAFFFISN